VNCAKVNFSDSFQRCFVRAETMSARLVLSAPGRASGPPGTPQRMLIPM
jgi:hypothetical protein